MQTSVTFKNLDPSDTLKTYVNEKLDRLDRFLDNPAEANVVLAVEKFRHIAEINIVGDRLNIIGKEATSDMYLAVDMVADKLEKQLKKSKEKVRKHRSGAKGRREILPVAERATENSSQREIKIINIDYKPMGVEEAVMQLDLSDDNFLVFTNARTDRLNVLYKRSDGDLGLIQPG